MKKITAILLMALMVLSLTACGNQTGKDNNGSEGSTEPTSVTITTLNGQKEATPTPIKDKPIDKTTVPVTTDGKKRRNGFKRKPKTVSNKPPIILAPMMAPYPKTPPPIT